MITDRLKRRLTWGFVLALALALALRYYDFVRRPVPLLDERVYVNAARAIERGASPYDSEFLYLPAFAWLVAFLIRTFGETTFLAGLRVLNIVAAAAFAWFGSRTSNFRELPRGMLAVAFLLLSPAVGSSISTGNPTFLVGIALYAALELAGRRPIAAGSLIGVTLLVKPLAPGLIAWLAGCRQSGRAWGFRCAVAAGLIGGLGLFPLTWLQGLLHQVPPIHSGEHNASVYQLLEMSGWRIPPPIFVLGVCLMGFVLARFRERRPEDQLFWSVPVMLLAAPLLWNHTLCLTWPLQAAALGLAWRRRQIARFELPAVLLGIVLMAVWHGIHGLPSDAHIARLFFTAAPALTPIALAAYWLAVQPLMCSRSVGKDAPVA